MNANANNANVESQKRAWLRLIGYLFYYGDIRNQLIHDYQQKFNITDTANQIVSQYKAQHPNHFPRFDQPWNQNNMHNPPHQNVLQHPRATKQKETVNAELDEFLRRCEAGTFNIACHLDHDEGDIERRIYYITVPQLSDVDNYYNIELMKVATRYARNELPAAVLCDYYLKKFDNRMSSPSSTVCLRKGWNGFHTTAAHADVVNDTTVPIPMVQASVALDTSRHIDWNKVHIGNISEEERDNREELWDPSIGSLNEPLPPNLRNHESVVHMNPSRQPCPSIAQLRQHLTDDGYDHMIGDYALIALDMPDRGNAHMEGMRDLNCLMPSNCQNPTALIANPRHFNKRAIVVGEGSQAYQEIRSERAQVVDQATDCHDIASGAIMERLQSEQVVNRDKFDSFDHWYASSSILGSAAFFLTHWYDDSGVVGPLLHYPNQAEEFSRSAMIQVLANDDMRKVGAHGIDGTNSASLEHIIRGRLPIPIIASYHVTWGPAIHPILGATFTVHEKCYRPARGKGIVKFTFV